MVAFAFFVVCIPWMLGLGQKLPLPDSTLSRMFDTAAQFTPVEGDADGDGLVDAWEDELLERHAPTFVLAENEPSLPASTSWLAARVALDDTGPRLLGVSLPSRRFDAELRRGSADRNDWQIYGHAYPSASGGIRLQYWSYFPFNDGPLFFDHESDWEHVTVELDPSGEPVAVSYARHENNAPGVRYAWSDVGREGNHPVVLVARGTHAAYARPDEAPFWETLPAVDVDERGLPIASSAGARAWRPGRDAPSVLNVGERSAPRDADRPFIGYRGLWGAALLVGTAAPPGPPWQRGFCYATAAGRCR